MKTKFAITWLVFGTLVGPVVALAVEDADTDRSNEKAATKTFVKDSAITTKIKTKLAAEHITSLGRIHVDTDEAGVVWLRGNARTQEAADKAVSIARETEGVKAVHSRIKVKKDD
jgi:hyperosmotically inducible protein